MPQSENTAGETAADASREASCTANLFMEPVELQSLAILQSIIVSVRVLKKEIVTTPPSGHQVKESTAEMIPPATLFHPEMIALPSFYREPRKLLDRYGASLQQHSSHRAIMTLATSLYEDQEDTHAATDMARATLAAGRRSTTSPIHDAAGSGPSRSDIGAAPAERITASTVDKVAHNAAMRLKEKDERFGGDLGESWIEFVS